VRTEIGGKEILIGVYPVGIVVPLIPWMAFGCLHLGVFWSGDGDLNFNVRVLNPVNVQAGEITGTAHAIWQGFQSSVTVRGLMMNFEMEGVYDVQISQETGPWESILKIPVFIARPT
jgi:hypothetical protein